MDSYPGPLQDRIEQAFDSTIADSGDAKGTTQAYRDIFKYFAEYNGRVIPLAVLENDHMLADLVKKTKGTLSFLNSKEAAMIVAAS